MNEIEILDAILNIIVKSHADTAITIRIMFKENNIIGITDRDLYPSLDKLIKDGFITHDADGFYRVTVEGKKFKKLGGYSGSERRRKNSKTSKIIMNVIIAATACIGVIIAARQCNIAKQTKDMQTQVDTLKHQ